MGTYDVRTHGIWSSQFAEAGKHENAAYDVSGATVNQHAVWWLWPNTCLLRYPGHANFMVLQDIGLVESVQRGIRTPAFDQGRIVYDPAGSGLSEYGLLLIAYRSEAGNLRGLTARSTRAPANGWRQPLRQGSSPCRRRGPRTPSW